jgi:spore maturation protein CgeB
MRMRWLIGHPGPNFSVADVYAGWVEALRSLGEQVYTFNLDRRLQLFDAALINDDGLVDGEGRPAVRKAMSRAQAIEMATHEILKPAFLAWPDVVLLVSAFWYPAYLLDAMRGRRMTVVLLHTESPYQDGEQLERAGHADINLVNDPVNITAYRDLGVPAEYMPHAYRPGIHYPAGAGEARKWDFAFVGTGFPSRVEFFEQMDLDGLDVHLAGPWLDLPPDSQLRDWAMFEHEACVSNDETAAIYRATRTGINFYRRESEQAHAGQGWAMGPREVEMAACGTWFTRDPRGENDEVLGMLPAFTGPAEASEQVRWALTHPRQREKAAAAAREAVAGRTFEANAKRLLKLLGH